MVFLFIEIYCIIVDAILNYYLESVKCDFDGIYNISSKFRNQRFLVRHRTLHFSQKIKSRDPVPLKKDDSKTSHGTSLVFLNASHIISL